MFIVRIDVPKFGRVCDPADKQVILSDTANKPYYYVIRDGSVVAVAKPDHIIQQDTINSWPIVLSDAPCESATVPVVAVPVQSSPVDQAPVVAPAASVPDEVPVAPVKQPAVKTVEPAVKAAAVPLASVGSAEVDSSVQASSKANLAETGPSALGFWFGVGLVALAVGGILVSRRWLFSTGRVS
jgi:hypothetical protein